MAFVIFALIAYACVRAICYDPFEKRWVNYPAYYVLAGFAVGILGWAGLVYASIARL